MPSQIDPTKPVPGEPASKEDLRANLQAARTELEHGGFFTQAGAGAVERPTQAKLREFHISAADFGAVGGGSTDNSAALITMRNWMLTQPDAHHVIYFPPGEYHYTNNRWLLNVRSYEVIGYGCTFRCIRSDAGGTHWFNTNCLNVSDPWSDNGDVDYSLQPGFPTHNGYLFESAARGDTTITCVTSADAGNFAAGDRVLIHGWAQQSSNYPPNPRYHEWHVVVSADDETGAITFDAPLRFMYDIRWRDGFSGPAFFWGAPRIMKLERANYIHPVLAIFRGGHWAPNPNAATNIANAFQPLGDTVLIEDVRCLYYVPQVSRYVRAERVHADNIIEPDKVLGRVELLNCRADGDVQEESIREATGCWDLVIDGLQARRGVKINARNQTIRNSVIMGEPDTSTLGIYRTRLWAVRSVHIQDTTLINIDPSLSRFLEVSVMESVTVGSVAGGVLRFPDNTANRNALEQFSEIGTTLLTRDGTRGGKITNVYPAGGDIVVEGDWRGDPQAGDVLYFLPVMDFSIERCSFDGLRAAKRDDRFRAYPGRLCRYELSQNDLVWTGENVLTNEVRGRVVRAALAVDAVYRGASSLAYLQLWDDDSGTGGNLLLSADLKTAGYREVTCNGGTGPTVNDKFGPAHIGKWCHWLSTRLIGTLGNSTYAELPKFRLVVDVLGPEA